MVLGVFLSIMFFVVMGYLTNRNNDEYKKPTGVKRVTVDSLIKAERKELDLEIAEIKRGMIIEFENILEIGLTKTYNDSADKMPSNIPKGSEMDFIQSKVKKYIMSVRFEPLFTKVLSGFEIDESINRVHKRVLDRIVNAMNNN